AGYPARPGGFAVNALTSAFTQFVPSRDARVYDGGVGPREDRSGVIGSTAPTTWAVWGATAEQPGFPSFNAAFLMLRGVGLWCVQIGRASLAATACGGRASKIVKTRYRSAANLQNSFAVN